MNEKRKIRLCIAELKQKLKLLDNSEPLFHKEVMEFCRKSEQQIVDAEKSELTSYKFNYITFTVLTSTLNQLLFTKNGATMGRKRIKLVSKQNTASTKKSASKKAVVKKETKKTVSDTYTKTIMNGLLRDLKSLVKDNGIKNGSIDKRIDGFKTLIGKQNLIAKIDERYQSIKNAIDKLVQKSVPKKKAVPKKKVPAKKSKNNLTPKITEKEVGEKRRTKEIQVGSIIQIELYDKPRDMEITAIHDDGSWSGRFIEDFFVYPDEVVKVIKY